MHTEILEKIEAHVPALAQLSESYRERHQASVRAAIINAVLSSEVRYLTREEVLYLAWIKADHDRRARELDEDLKRQWLKKQRRFRQDFPVRRNVGRPTGQRHP